MPGLPRDPLTIWTPVPGVDAAARLDAELRLRAVTRLGWRPDGNIGLFASTPIGAGTLLVHRWHDHYYLGMTGWRVLSIAEPAAVRASRATIGGARRARWSSHRTLSGDVRRRPWGRRHRSRCPERTVRDNAAEIAR